MRFDAQVLAYCQMGNHFHLVLHTRLANLSRFMRQLNGAYAQAFNRRHGLVGRLLQGRFKAILVDRDAYLLTLCRSVERDPVAAGLVAEPARWRWSSCRAHLGLAPSPRWLDSDGLHAHLAGRAVAGAADRREARARYADLVAQPVSGQFWAESLRQQIFLGDEHFVQHELSRLAPRQRASREVPRVHRRVAARTTSFQHLLAQGHTRDQALYLAYTRGGQTMSCLAQEAGLSVSRVSRLIAAQDPRHEPGRAGAAMTRPDAPSPQRGFTLLELLVVGVIIGVLAAYVGPRYFTQIGKSEQGTARMQIDALAKALETYRIDAGRYPGTEQGLAALMTRPADESKWAGPYLVKAVPKDPWGRPYLYRSPGADGADFDLRSLGRDGQTGGEGDNADLSYR
jgi:type II secretion system protein G